MPNARLPPFKLSPAAHHRTDVTVALPHHDEFLLRNICSKNPIINHPHVFFDYTLQLATFAVESARKGSSMGLDYGDRWVNLGIPLPADPYSNMSQPEIQTKLSGVIYHVRMPIPLIETYQPLSPARTAINALRWFIPAAGAIVRGTPCRQRHHRTEPFPARPHR